MDNSSSSTSESTLYDPYEDFYKHFDEILDIYYMFEEMFSFSPAFLENAKGVDLYNFLEDFLIPQSLSENDSPRASTGESRFVHYTSRAHHEDVLYDFCEEYQNELNCSWSVLNSFLKRIKAGKILPYVKWCKFAFKFSYYC